MQVIGLYIQNGSDNSERKRKRNERKKVTSSASQQVGRNKSQEQILHYPPYFSHPMSHVGGQLVPSTHTYLEVRNIVEIIHTHTHTHIYILAQ